MSPRLILSSLTLLTLACAPPAPRVIAPPPAAARVWIFALERPERPEQDRYVFIAAADLSAAVHFLSKARAATLFALGYEQSPEELGLTLGPLPASQPCRQSCGLTRPSVSYALRLDAAGEPRWMDGATVTGAVIDLLVPDHGARCNAGCLRVTSPSLDLGVSQPVALVTEVLGVSAILGTQDGRLIRVRGTPELEALCTANGFAISAAFLQPGSRTLWLASSDGRLATVALDAISPGAPCPLTIEGRVPAGVHRLAGPQSGPLDHLHTLSSTGALGRVEGGRYRHLALLPRRVDELDPNNPTRYGFLLDRGDVVYASIGARELAVLRGDNLALRRPEITGVAQVNLISAVVSGGEVLIAASANNVMRIVDDIPVPIVDPTLTDHPWSSPASIAVLQGRAVALLRDGFFGEWSARLGYCPQQATTVMQDATQSAVVGDALFVADGTDPNRAPPYLVHWITPDRTERCPQ